MVFERTLYGFLGDKTYIRWHEFSAQGSRWITARFVHRLGGLGAKPQILCDGVCAVGFGLLQYYDIYIRALIQRVQGQGCAHTHTHTHESRSRNWVIFGVNHQLLEFVRFMLMMSWMRVFIDTYRAMQQRSAASTRLGSKWRVSPFSVDSVWVWCVVLLDQASRLVRAPSAV